MHRWETRMLLKHYLERGVSKAELSRRFGVSRRTIHEWVETGQLDRDLSSGSSRYSPRPPTPHKLDPYTAIIYSRLEEFPGLSAPSTGPGRAAPPPAAACRRSPPACSASSPSSRPPSSITYTWTTLMGEDQGMPLLLRPCGCRSNPSLVG